jgi:hypothetical protein
MPARDKKDKSSSNKKGERRKKNQDSSDDEGDNDNDVAANTVFASITIPKTVISSSSDVNDMVISEAVEMLLEKRLSQREQALITLVKMFASGQSLESYQETILIQLSRLIRKPSSFIESDNAAKLIMLFSLWLGADEDAFFETFDSLLQKLITTVDVDENIRVVALSTLAFCSFINSVESRERILTLCEDIICESNNDGNDTLLCFTAIKSWILLASIIPIDIVIDSSKDRIFDAVNLLLDSDDIDVKIAAGTLLAFLYELVDDNDLCPEGSDMQTIGLQLCEDPNVVSQTLALIQRVSKENSKRFSKKDRKDTRLAFRDIEAYIFNGEKPEDSIRMQGCVLEVETFAKICLLEQLKAVLGDGFPASPKNFPIVQEILEIKNLNDFNDGDGNNLQIRKGSSVDKSRSTNRSQDRHYKDSFNSFYEEC